MDGGGQGREPEGNKYEDREEDVGDEGENSANMRDNTGSEDKGQNLCVLIQLYRHS